MNRNRRNTVAARGLCPTYAWDFTTGQLDPRITFTRASGARYFDSAGVLKTAGVDVARFDHVYDGSIWVPKGLLIEEARTNLLLQSEAIAAAPWVALNSVEFFSNIIVAPDGTTTADRMNDVITNGFGAIEQSFTIATTNLPYTYSVFVKKANQSTHPEFQMLMTGGTNVTGVVQLDIGTGATDIRLDVGGGGASVKVEDLDDYWRISLTVSNAGSNTTLKVLILAAISTTLGGVNTSLLGGINVWGQQLEQASFATSYIKTTSAAVTRAVDVATISDVSWFNATEGTFFVKADDGGTPPGAFARLTELNDGADSDRLIMMMDNGKPRIFVGDGGVTQAALAATNSIVSGTTFKVAGAYKLNDIAVTSEGTAVNTDTTATMPDETNFNFTIGTDRAAAIAFWNGHIAEIKYWKARRSDGFLQRVTA